MRLSTRLTMLMQRDLLLLRTLLVLCSYTVSTVRAECEKRFDAVMCNRESNGYAFRGDRMWAVECDTKYISVLETTEKQLPFVVTAAMNDMNTEHEFSYLFQVSKQHALDYR